MSEAKNEVALSDLLNAHAQDWKEESRMGGEDTIWYLYGEGGHSLSVLDRMTGWGGGTRDVETGYRSPEGRFWLASCDFDIRRYGELSYKAAIEKVKQNTNTCVGV